MHQILEQPGLAHEFGVSAVLGDASVRNHQQPLTILHRGQPVGDEDDRAPTEIFFDGLLDQLLAERVERAGGFIEDETLRLGQQGAGDGKPLALAAGKRRAAFAHARGEPAGQLGDEFPRVGQFAGMADGGIGGVGPGDPDVVAHGCPENKWILRDDAELLAQIAGLKFPQVHAAEAHRPGLRVVEPEEELRERGLARAGRTDKGETLPVRNRERQIAQHRLPCHIGEIHLFKNNFSFRGDGQRGALRVGCRTGRIQHHADAVDRGLGAAPQAERLEHHLNRIIEPDERRQARGHSAEVDVPAEITPSARRQQGRIAKVAEGLLLHVLDVAEHIAFVGLAADDQRLPVEILRHLVLHRIELHGLVAAQHVGDPAADVALGRLEIAVDLLHLFAGADHQRHAGEGRGHQHQRHQPVPPPEHPEGHQHGDDGPRHVHRRVLEELHDVVQRRAEEVAEQLTRRMLAVEAQAEVADVPEKLAAQGEHHALAHPGEHPVARVPGRHARDERHHEEARNQPAEPLPALGGGQAGFFQHLGEQPFRHEVLQGDGGAMDAVEQQRADQQPAVPQKKRPDVPAEGVGRGRGRHEDLVHHETHETHETKRKKLATDD